MSDDQARAFASSLAAALSADRARDAAIAAARERHPSVTGRTS